MRPGRLRTWLSLVVAALLVVGLLVLASASGSYSTRLFGNQFHFITRQVVWVCVAVVGALCACYFDYHKWKEYPVLTILGYLFVLGLLIAVLYTDDVKGSRRWIDLGLMRLQPGELAKIFSIMALSVFIDKAGWKVELFVKGLLPALAILGVYTVFTLLEPDYGTTFILCVVGGSLLIVGGFKILQVMGIGIVGLFGFLGIMLTNANRANRIISWLPANFAKLLGYTDAQIAEFAARDANHQLNQALVAIQNGGIWGVGMNKSLQKHAYLPEAHTDFIFAVGAEEFGLVFSLGVFLLFAAFFVLGMIISYKAKDRLGKLLAFGMTLLIFFQAMFNIGVVCGCLPTKGLALPFISYGGTSLISTMIAVGIIFNVARQIELQKIRPRSKIQPFRSKE